MERKVILFLVLRFTGGEKKKNTEGLTVCFVA